MSTITAVASHTKFILSSAALLKYTRVAALLVKHNPVVPVLENVLLRVSQSNKFSSVAELRIISSDLEHYYTSAPLPIEGRGGIDGAALCVPAKQLADLLRALPDQPLTLDMLEEPGQYPALHLHGAVACSLLPGGQGQAEFLFNPAWGGHSSSVEQPAPTVVARQDKAPVGLVQAEFMLHNYGGERFDRNRSLEEPAGTITTTGGQQYLVQGELMFQNNFDNLPASVEQPARTLTTNGGNQFLMTYYGQGGTTGMDQACPTLTTRDRVAKVEAEQGFLFSHQFSNEPRSLEEPARTLVASRRHQYLAMLEPGACPPHLLPQPGDSLTMRLLKYVCRKYGIADIRMRMLKVPELLQIQGFPAGYVLHGTQTQQKKFIGNAVVPHVARALVGANIDANNERQLAVAA